MNMAKYLLSILRLQMGVVLSWGIHRLTALPNNEGLAFRVDGYKHRGWVFVRYRQGKDLFDVELRTYSMQVIETIEDVYFDQLVAIIDRAVEKTTDYEDRVKNQYFSQGV